MTKGASDEEVEDLARIAVHVKQRKVQVFCSLQGPSSSCEVIGCLLSSTPAMMYHGTTEPIKRAERLWTESSEISHRYGKGEANHSLECFQKENFYPNLVSLSSFSHGIDGVDTCTAVVRIYFIARFGACLYLII